MKRLIGTAVLAAAVLLALSALPVVAQDGGGAAQSYRVYVVKWYEDLDDVAEKFGVSKETLMRFNNLKSEKLSRRQRLRIPDNPDAVTAVPQDSLASVAESPAAAPADSLSAGAPEDDDDEGVLAVPKSRVDAILMMPFLDKDGNPDESSYDFYAGVILAAKDLDDAGVKSRLTVVDVGSERASWFGMLGTDFVLGPVSPADIDSVRRSCPRGCAVISPLDPKGAALAQAAPNVIQAPAPVSAQDEDLAAWIREDLGPEDRLIVLQEKDAALPAVTDVLAASGLEFGELSYGILEGRKVIDEIKAMMTATGVNRVVIASDNEAFVNDALRNINLIKVKDGYDVVLYSHSRIRSFSTIEVENLHNVRAHVVCGYYVDYDSPRVKSFVMRYRALFGTEPSPFAYQGYDTAWYFISSFATGESLRRRMERLGSGRVRVLQSDFRMVRTGEGWANNAVRRVVYGDNYSISLL